MGRAGREESYEAGTTRQKCRLFWSLVEKMTVELRLWMSGTERERRNGRLVSRWMGRWLCRPWRIKEVDDPRISRVDVR